jgi:high-affinity iron transporter
MSNAKENHYPELNMTAFLGRCLMAIAIGFGASLAPAWAAETPVDNDQQVRQLWQLLDYVAVDYPGAVANGVVSSEGEYQEMREFSDNAVAQAKALPPHGSHGQLVSLAEQLRNAVLQKAPADRVADLAQQAGGLLLTAYPIPVAPRLAPDLAQGQRLYQVHCAACHGPTGGGDGPASKSLDPKPVDFTDKGRARARSILALYQVTSQGVEGTSMPSFKALPDQDRWALAFYVGTLSFDAAARERGAAMLQNDPKARAALPDLAALTTASESLLVQHLGAQATDLLAFARSEPQAITGNQLAGIPLARSQMQASLKAFETGNGTEAIRLALSAYLDGFEPLEAALESRNKDLLVEVERTMQLYRSAIAAKQADVVVAKAHELDLLFSRVDGELSAGRADATTSFIAALTILLREGVEALLIVVAMIAFLRKANQGQALRYVHGGWVTALAAGGVTWWIATYVVGVSGASREVTEGLSSLFAAAVLLSVGLWMHQKSSAGRWQAYLRDKLSAAMTRRSAWALFLLAFVAVYREVFETVLFFSALAADGHGSALLAGLAVGLILLAIIAAVFLRTSARMPVGTFFSLSSILVAVLAVVLAGKGVSGLQEAGWLSATPVGSLRVPVLGIFPTLQTSLAQVAVLLAALLGFGLNAMQARRAAPA